MSTWLATDIILLLAGLIVSAWLIGEAARNPRRSFIQILGSACRRHRHDHHRLRRFLGILAVELVLATALGLAFRIFDQLPASGIASDDRMIEHRREHR